MMAVDARREKIRSGIYLIRCTANGRVYVGSSVRVARRWVAHRVSLRIGTHHSRIMQRSWNKYGEDAFEFLLLEEVSDLTDLISREQHWIDQLSAACPRRGMNASPTAGNCLGVRHSAKTRALLSRIHKGRAKSPEHRRAIGEAQIGKVIPDDQRRLLSEATRRFFANNDQARARMREVGRRNGSASKGRVYDEATRARMAKARSSSEACRAAAIANLAKMSHEARMRGFSLACANRNGRPNRKNRSLSYETAEEIRAAKEAGATYDQLEVRYGLNRSSLHHLIKRKTYTAP